MERFTAVPSKVRRTAGAALASLLIVAGVPLLGTGVAGATPGALTLESTTSGGVKADFGVGALFSASDDGSVVVFDAQSTTNFPGPSGEIWAKNTVTGALTLASASTAGDPANGFSSEQTVSRNGRFVVFVSNATNLDPGDTDTKPDLFVKDLQTGVLALASTNASGIKGNQTGIGLPSVSNDGTEVVFPTNASNFLHPQVICPAHPPQHPVPYDCTQFEQYLKNLSTGALTLLTPVGTARQAVTGTISSDISADGTKIAIGTGEDLTPQDTDGGLSDVYVYDVPSGTATLASTDHPSIDPDATLASGYFPYMSADGNRIAFQGGSSTWAPGDGSTQVYVKDMATGALTLASSNGATANDLSQDIEISGDGNFVSFSSFATNLLPADTEANGDIYLKNLATGDVTLVTTTDAGVNSDGHQFISHPVDGGGAVIFSGGTTNLDPADTDFSDDVYLKVLPPPVAAADADGVSATIEDGAPAGDGNGDGIADSTQNEVTSLPAATDGSYVTVAAPAGTSVVNAATAPVPDNPPPPVGATFPEGLLSFEVHGVTPGGSADVQLFLPTGVTPTSIYKFQHGAYVDATGASDIAGNVVTLHLLDGGPLDADGLANGIIEDPVVVNAPVVTNHPPVANDDGYSTNEDTALSVPAPGVLGNDTDADSDALSAAVTTGPAHGTLGLAADGSFLYTPAHDFNGPDSFTYTASDGEASPVTATVNLTVNAVNDAPTATAVTTSTNEDTAKTLTLTGTDVDGNATTFTVVTSPSHGTLGPLGTVGCTGTVPKACTRTVTYTPAANFNGPDAFTYRVNDGAANSSAATVAITVVAVNDAPTLTPFANLTVKKNTQVLLPFLIGDIDSPLNALIVSGSSSITSLVPNSGIAFGTIGPVHLIAITPAKNKTGTTTITVRVSDGLLITTRTFTLTFT